MAALTCEKLCTMEVVARTWNFGRGGGNSGHLDCFD